MASHFSLMGFILRVLDRDLTMKNIKMPLTPASCKSRGENSRKLGDINSGVRKERTAEEVQRAWEEQGEVPAKTQGMHLTLQMGKETRVVLSRSRGMHQGLKQEGMKQGFFSLRK